MQHIHGDKIEVEEIKNEVLELILLDADTQEIRNRDLLKDIKLEEEWNEEVLLVFELGIFDVSVVLKHSWVASELTRERHWS